MELELYRKGLAQFLWYARRPHLYVDFARRATHLRRARDSDSAPIQQAAREWCEENQISLDEFSRQIGVHIADGQLANNRPLEWKFAKLAEANCPVRMGGAGQVDLLYSLVRGKEATKVVETGVAYGWSSLAILLALDELGEGRLWSVDRPYPLLNNDAFVGCVVPPQLRSRWELIRRADRDGLPRIFKFVSEIDLAHYDSDKSYPGRIYGYRVLWERLKAGGLLISDDVNNNFAFRDFSEEVARRPRILSKGDGFFLGVIAK